MLLKKISKKTNGTRHQKNLQKNLLSKYNRLIKKLSIFIHTKAGRNNSGKITIRHKGGSSVKKLTHVYNVFDFYENAITLCILYDSKRNSFVSLNFDLKKKKFFKSLSIKNLFPGSIIKFQKNLTDYKIGYKSYLINLPMGSIINSISNKKKFIFSRSAGSFSQIIEQTSNFSRIRLPSGKIMKLNASFCGTLGIVANLEYKTTVLGKAGRSRLKNKRPSVRGIAMNPVDHPHGGKSNKGKPPLTPWGLPAKNQPTVKKKNYE
jgi:large subunit ribosomal protein L2